MESLPAEIIYNICSYMSAPAIINLSMICKQIYYNMPSFMQLHRGKFINIINEINKIKYEIQEYDTPKYILGDPINAVSLREINGKKYRLSIANTVTNYYMAIETAEIIYVGFESPPRRYLPRVTQITNYNNKLSMLSIRVYEHIRHICRLHWQIGGDDLIS